MLVAFDFDGTLMVDGELDGATLRLLMRHVCGGHECCVITSRNPEHEQESWYAIHEPARITVRSLLDSESIDLPVYYTSHAPKIDAMVELGVYRLFDDDPAEIMAVRAAGRQAISVIGRTGQRLLAPDISHVCDVCRQDAFLLGAYRDDDGMLCGHCLSAVFSSAKGCEIGAV